MPTIPFLSRRDPPGYQAPGETPDGPVVPAADQELVELVDRRYKLARQAKEGLLRVWATCLAFFVGEQWRDWDEQQRRMVVNKRIPKWRVQMVDNQIPGILDTAAAKLARSRQTPRCLPNTSEPEDEQAAEIGTRALAHWWHTDEMDVKELEANVQRTLFGGCFFHDYWDPTRTAKLAVPDYENAAPDPETGIPTPKMTAVRAPVGDVCVELLSVFDVFPEPCQSWRDVTWCLVARRKPLHWFRDTFPERGAEVQADPGDIEDAFSALVPGGDRGFGTTQAGTADLDQQATLKTYYEKPCKQYPQGRTVMVAGQVLLFHRDELPMPHGELPLVLFQYRYVPKRLWPMGLVEHLIGQQRELNRGQSNLSEILRLFRSPKWLLPRRTGVAHTAITSSPDEVVEYDPVQGMKPEVVSPPNLPPWIAQFPEMQRESMRQLSGQHDVSEGGVPAGVTAASAINLLQRADNTRLSAPATYGAAGLQQLAQHVLVSIVARWREERLISTFGRDRAQQILALKGADIGDRDVRVDLTEGVEDSGAVRSQQVVDWLGAGLFNLPMPIVLQILRDVDQEWLAEDLEKALPQVEAEAAQQQAQAQAQRDEQAMQQQALAEGQAGQQQEQAAAQEQARAAGEQAKLGFQAQEAERQRAHEAALAQGQGANALALAQLRRPPGQPVGQPVGNGRARR